MTYEQALEIKQNLTPEQVRNDLERYLLRGEAPIVKGVAMAMQALEKQIPKKPIPHKVEGGKIKIGNGWWCKGTTVHKCPNCNEFISRTYDYCYKCGQALEWGESE